MQARLALSPDAEFTAYGGTTQIEYGEAYIGYKNSAARLSRSKFGQSTLTMWNANVFKNVTARSSKGNGDRGMDPDGFSNLDEEMDEAEAEEQEDEMDDSDKVSEDEVSIDEDVDRGGSKKNANDSDTEVYSEDEQQGKCSPLLVT